MAVIVVERSFRQPADLGQLETSGGAAGDCFVCNGIRAKAHFISRDRRHVVCVYEAPDAEAVRISQAESNLPYDRLWPAHHLEPDERAQPEGFVSVVVQRRPPQAITVEDAVQLSEEAADCRRNNRTPLWESFLALDGRDMICRYYAPDADSVRRANDQAGLPWERAWSATIVSDS